MQKDFVKQKALIRTFRTSIFYCKITFLNSQHENTYSKVDLILKTMVLNVCFKDYYKNKSKSKISILLE